MPRPLPALLLTLLLIALPACTRKRDYPQASPDDVIKSAVEMVQNDEAARLPTLIYAESPEMRQVLNQLGVLMGNLQRLAKSCALRWPDDYAKLQEQAIEQAQKSGGSLLGALGSGGRGMNRGGGGGGGDPDQMRQAFNAVLADPYGWIQRSAPRLSTTKTSDDTAAILLDGQPAIPLVGLPMKLDQGRWYVTIPSSVPPLNQAWPKTKAQWAILGSMIKTTDQAVVALNTDVAAGRVGSVKQLVDTFQEKAIFPIMIATVPYGREMDVGNRAERRLGQLRSRQREWVKSRASAGLPVSPKVTEALLAVAPPKIEAGVRANKLPAFDKLSDLEFQDLAQSWLREAGLNLKFDEALEGPAIEKAVADWREQRAKPKPKP